MYIGVAPFIICILTDLQNIYITLIHNVNFKKYFLFKKFDLMSFFK